MEDMAGNSSSCSPTDTKEEGMPHNRTFQNHWSCRSCLGKCDTSRCLELLPCGLKHDMGRSLHPMLVPDATFERIESPKSSSKVSAKRGPRLNLTPNTQLTRSFPPSALGLHGGLQTGINGSHNRWRPEHSGEYNYNLPSSISTLCSRGDGLYPRFIFSRGAPWTAE